MNGEDLKTVTCTFKIKAKYVNHLENFLLENTDKLASYEVLQNTDHLKDDKEFKKLVKEVKQAKIEKYNYVDKNS